MSAPALPNQARAAAHVPNGGPPAASTPPVGPYRLPDLPFGPADLAPVIDEETLRLHHGVHHRAYVDGVNAALARHPEWLGLSIETVLRRLDEVPADIRREVRDFGGGHANHQFFWKILDPRRATDRPVGELARAIDRHFGSFDGLRARFQALGEALVGSGWVFLVADPARGFALEVLALPDQECVLTRRRAGLLLCDLWEHAYYLRYRDRRQEWLSAWWQLVDWSYADRRYAAFRAGATHF